MHGAYLFLCHRGDHYLFLLTFCHSFAGHVQEELLYINWQIKLNLFRRKIKTDAKPSKNWPARHGNEEKRKIQNIRNITLNLQVQHANAQLHDCT